MTDQLQHNLSNYNLKQELSSLERLINVRITELTENRISGIETFDDVYEPESLLKEENNCYERLIIALALASSYFPAYFSAFMNETFRLPFYKTGGVLNNNRFYPTLLTYLFLIEGVASNPYLRLQLIQMLNRENFFARYIHLLPADDDEDYLSKQLFARKETISYLIDNRAYSPDHDSRFPATKIKSRMNWEDLVLPYDTLERIEEIVNWDRYGQIVLTEFDLGRKLKRGYRTLFYGPSGTGKTLTASLIGKKLNKEVYRINSAQVVSKYVGETEKNLDKIFEYAEDKNWILFFDEAEALFGKRTSVSTANDRYANQQVAFLLQRIEDFPGIIILSSNKKGEMDQAFLRRFQLMLEFKMPDFQERLLLWKKGIEKDFSTDQTVDLYAIADHYEIAGGVLINILRTLSINALKNNNRTLNQNDILKSIQTEFEKMGKTFSLYQI